MIDISVVMPVHNAETYVSAAIRSILSQRTLRKVELLVVDDGSTDGTAETIRSISAPELTLLQPGRIGFAHALNLAIQEAKGSFIARMDGDDIAEAGRLEMQSQYLQDHPEIAVIGSSARLIGDAKGVMHYPTDPEDVRAELLFRCAICHPSAMLRRELFSSGEFAYDNDAGAASDYRLWTSLIIAGRKIANLRAPLLKYRIHKMQVTQSDRERQNTYSAVTRKRLLGAWGLDVSPSDLELHNRIARWEIVGDSTFLTQLEQWLLRIHAWNNTTRQMSMSSLGRVLSMTWFTACVRTTDTRAIRGRWRESPLFGLSEIPRHLRARFFLKQLLHRGS